MDYKEYIRSYNNFPKEGVVFWDFTYLLKDVKARNHAINEMMDFLKDKHVDKIVAIEAKGFTIGSIIANNLQLPLVLIRKPNLIPEECYSEVFTKEYGQAEYQIKKDAINNGERVAIIYDIMAGSGASLAAINLVKKCDGIVDSLLYVTELEYLDGRKDLNTYNIFSLVRIADKND